MAIGRVMAWAAVATLATTAAIAAPAAIPAGATYVALGSSYASGPGITQPAPGWDARCSQSQDNYARQLARARGLRLVDRSCGGATTVDVLKGGQFDLPPQLDAVTADTRLVTITIAGNDVRFTGDLAVTSCRHAGGATCPSVPADFDLEKAFASAETNMRAMVAEIRRRAPQARVVFVDYVTILPAGAPCPALSLDAADAAALKARADRLAAVTERVARETGSGLVKASELTRGHDACAAEPWSNGAVRRGPGWGPTGFHPNLPAMSAIAQALDRMLAN